jgi:hypothetical protein
MRFILGFVYILSSFSGFAAVDHWETVVYETDTWRYIVPTSAVSPTWTTIAYNDAAWLTGPGGFGYGDGDDNTTFPATESCYQRITFNITNVSAIDLMLFHIDYDDSFVAYLNGVEISRDNITSAGQPPYNQLADGNHEALMYAGGLPTMYQLDAAFILANMVNGANVLCIQIHNQSATSSDMSSRAFLSLGINDTSNDYGPTPPWFVAPIIFTSSNLPIVVINTAGGANIPDDPKIDATMGIIYNGVGMINNLTDPYNEYNGDIGIERRGSSSGGFPKKQWGLETRDPSGLTTEVSIFDMAYDNDWVLYAPYSDKSLLRNVLTYKMGWDTEQYAPRTKLCEVMLNGEYQGVYVFTEKIKRKDGKVGNNDVEPWDISGNELTGDYILKVDKTTAGGSVIWTSPFPPYAGAPGLINHQAHDPDLIDLQPEQMTYIENVVTAFETALDGPNFSDPITGYAPYVDMGSFVDFMLVNEFGKNVDGYRISSFYHKKRLSDGGQIAAGPLWDFNLAWGNANYCDGGDTTGWEIDFYTFCGGGGLQNPFWWERLVQDPTFSHDMNCRWQEMRQGAWHTDTLMAYIDSMAAYLEESQIRNYQKWQVLGIYLWPNNYIGLTYADEVDYLKTWITDRATWMDANMFGVCNDLGISEDEQDHYRVFPNPANEFVTFEFPYLVDEASIILYDAMGKIVLQHEFNESYDVQLNLARLTTGIYHYRIIEPNKRTSIGKLNVN